MFALLVLLVHPVSARDRAAAPTLSTQAQLVLGTERSTALDLWRPWPDADKVLVPATLPDGSVELFLVDTGAATSVLAEDVAERLGLDDTVEAGYLSGLSGTVPWSRTMLPKLTLGGFELRGVEVAVGVPGVPDQLGPLPIAGILGTNVWSNFVVVVDYPADRLELHLAGAYRTGGRAAPLFVRDGSAATPVRMKGQDENGDTITATVLLEVDTGAHDLLLVGPAGEGFRAVSTRGEEPVLGIGANLDELPDRQLLQPTRRVHVVEVRAGGERLRTDIQASWLGADPDSPSPNLALPGLIGYTALRDHRVVLDYPGQTFRVTRSRGPERDFDALGAWLAQPMRDADTPRAALHRADVLWAKGERAQAAAELDAALVRAPDDPRLLIARANVFRLSRQWDDAIATMARLTPAALAEEGAWGTYIGSLVLAGRGEDALAQARAALDGAQDDHREHLLVALSDALVAAGRLDEASAAIDDANAASKRGGSAHLLRKARIAEAAGDRYGAMVALRELIDIIPLRGQPIWWYGLLVKPEDAETFRLDVERAMGRLHPGDEPFDFLGAAWGAVGEPDRARAALVAGRARDCGPLPAGADRDNCDAWYLALGRDEPETAQARITAALGAEPDNAAYLDTAAVVALAAGRPADAVRFAREAAMLSPDDPYLLWQLTRLEALGRPLSLSPSSPAAP